MRSPHRRPLPSSTGAGRRRASRRLPPGSQPLHCANRASTSRRPSPSASASANPSPPPATTAAETHGNFVWVRSGEALGERLEAAGLVVRIFADGIRISLRRPPENDVLLEALGARVGPASGRTSIVTRTSTETALRIVARPRRQRARARRDRDRVPRSPAHAVGVPRRLRPRAARRRRPRRRRAPHRRGRARRVGRCARGRARRPRRGRTLWLRLVPMDEALATAAVDLVRRPHAEVALDFAGDRVGGLAPSLLPHALERLAMEGGFTLHVRLGEGRSPRRGGRVQGARPGAPAGLRTRAAKASARRKASREGRARRLRRRQPAQRVRRPSRAPGRDPRSRPIPTPCARRRSP